MKDALQTLGNARMLPAIGIPPEILSLRDAKLPEKLLLAIYAADPSTKRVRRALSMTRAGWRKLEQRLIGKRLLTVLGGSHLVHVPGLVYTGHDDGGHFVSEKPTTKKRERVAGHASTAAQASAAALVIPAPLLGFKYLSASEKVLLAYYAANPDASNVEVVATLGVSTSGLKKLKSDLLERQVLIASDEGYTIRLPGHVLVRDSQGSHFVSESDAEKSGHKVAHDAPRLTPAKDVYKHWRSSIAQLSRNRHVGPSYLLSVTTKMIKRIEDESPEGPEREDALAEMRNAENLYFAADFIYDNIPRKYEAKCLALIGSATPEQLVGFRTKADAMLLAGMPEPKLLGMVTNSISPDTHEATG
jgi:hypothetical protein